MFREISLPPLLSAYLGEGCWCPPQAADLVEVELLVARPLDQGALAPLLLPHRGVETPRVRVVVAVTVGVGLKHVVIIITY